MHFETFFTIEGLVILLLFIATIVSIIAQRWRVPYTTGLVIVGLLLATLEQSFVIEDLHLNIGDPNIFDFDTPQHMKDAVTKAMKDGNNGYSPAVGIPEAVDAIRNEAERKGIPFGSDTFVFKAAQ